MRVPLSWLREHCATDLSADVLADRLSEQGVHVEDLLRPWDGLSGVIVARVQDKRAHPNSDKLTLATLDTGTAEAHVAAGVANWEIGDLICYAPPGSRVPALPDPLGVKRLRGEESQGMMCSPSELAISGDHGAILILPPGLPVGGDVKALLGLDDVVLDVEIEPNRPDLMSVVGVAREASAATGVPLSIPDTSVDESLESASGAAGVEVADPQRCPRYLARVIRGVSVSPSPIAVQARLTAAGMRPISNVVDATNYVLLEMGHPLHPFDLHRLAGETIVVRRAAEGERLETLDGVGRVLTAEDLLIADRAKGVAIAGIMGSAAAEVAADTSDVLLESAFFERTGVLWTSRRLGLSTEASARFERGADPEAVAPAAARAAGLIAGWAGGRVLGGACDVGTVPDRRRLVVRPSRTSFALGLRVTAGEVEQAFGRLGIEATEADPDEVRVEVPGYRVDLAIEEDLIEEVARLHGYMRLPSTMPAIRQAGGLADTYAFRGRVRDALLRAGARETTSIPFASAAEITLAGADPAGEVLRVVNPLDADRAFLRPSLIPGLVRALGVNLARQVRGAVLFEVGHVFRGSTEVDEREHVAAALTGPAWAGYPYRHRELDFFDAKGVLEALLASLGIERWSLGGPAPWPYHPGRSATVVLGGDEAGSLGELHPRAAEGADLPGRVTVLELVMPVLARHATSETSAADVPRLPPARRDLAFLVDQGVPAGAVQEAVLAGAGGLADSAVLFDVFEGDPLPAGKKNLAFAVEFRAVDRTLTDEEVDRAVAAIEARIRGDFGGELRAG